MKTVLLAAIPLASLALASLGGATTRSIYAYLSVANVPQNSFIFDCNHVRNGVYAQVETRARGADPCGNIISADSSGYGPDATTSTSGTSVQSQFDDTTFIGSCGRVSQHAARLQSYLFDSRDGFTATYSITGYTTSGGCWNSDLNSGTCVGATALTTVNSAIAPSNTCSNRQFQGVSLGSTP